MRPSQEEIQMLSAMCVRPSREEIQMLSATIRASTAFDNYGRFISPRSTKTVAPLLVVARYLLILLRTRTPCANTAEHPT